MIKTNKEDIYLILRIAIIIMVYIVIPLTRKELNNELKLKRMKDFNTLLDQNQLSFSILKSLKILIHNYESLDDKNILNSRDEEELTKAVDSLQIKHEKIFLTNTKTLNLLVFGSTLIPTVAYLIKKFLKRKIQFQQNK